MKFFLLSVVIGLCALLCGAQKGTLQQHLPKYNMLQNPGAENGLAKFAIANNATVEAEVTNPLFGTTSLKVDSTSIGDYVKTIAVPIPEGLYGADCEVSMRYVTESGYTASDYTLQAHDGTNVLVEIDLPVADTQRPVFASFACPSSGSLEFRIESNTTNAKYVTVDQMWLGSNLHTFEFSESSIYGTWIKPSDTGCTWVTSSSTMADIPALAACGDTTIVTTGLIDEADTNIPGFKMLDVGPGNYLVISHFKYLNAGSTGFNCRYSLSDGTSNSGEVNLNADTGLNQVGALLGNFTYTQAQGDVTVQIQGKNAGGGTCAVENSTQDNSYFTVYKFPLASQTAVTVDTQGMHYASYHGRDCLFSQTSSSKSDYSFDPTCTYADDVNVNFGTVVSYESGGNKGPGIVMTPNRVGTYYVCGRIHVRGNATAQWHEVYMTDGSGNIYDGDSYRYGSAEESRHPRFCAFVPITSLGSSETVKFMGKNQAGGQTNYINGLTASGEHWAIYWTIFPITQNFPQAVALGKFPKVAHIIHKESTTVAGGATTASSWNIRNITDTVNPQGYIWIGSVSSDTFTLNAGTYLIEGVSEFYNSGNVRTRLYNTTDAAVVANSYSVNMNSTVGDVAMYADTSVQFTITSQKTFRFEYYSTGAKGGNGQGVISSSGVDEVYANYKVTKVE